MPVSTQLRILTALFFALLIGGLWDGYMGEFRELAGFLLGVLAVLEVRIRFMVLLPGLPAYHVPTDAPAQTTDEKPDDETVKQTEKSA